MEAEIAPAQPLVRGNDDRVLVRRLQQREAAAHADLYRRFGPLLHRFAASRLDGDRELAEEVVVEALVDAVRDIARFDPRRSSFSAWLHGIARHRIQRERRKQLRSRSVPSSMQVPLDSLREVAGGDLAARVGDQVAARQRFSHLAAVLSDIELEVLVLRCVGELSLKEIGRIVGRSERAAESVLRRAKQKAREGVCHDVA